MSDRIDNPETGRSVVSEPRYTRQQARADKRAIMEEPRSLRREGAMKRRVAGGNVEVA